MTAVTSTYLLFAPEGFSLSKEISYTVGTVITIGAYSMFWIYVKKIRKSQS
jgi:hypothetical protein